MDESFDYRDLWLVTMRHASLKHIMSFFKYTKGIGEKSAEMIALFCLDQQTAVPIGTLFAQDAL